MPPRFEDNTHYSFSYYASILCVPEILRFRLRLVHDDKSEDSLEADADSVDSCKACIKFASTRVHRSS